MSVATQFPNKQAPPATGDSLAKPENITAPKAGHVSAYGGTSIIKNMPAAEIVEDDESDQPVTEADYQEARDVILMTMARHYLSGTDIDVFSHSSGRAAVELIESYDNKKTTINQPVASGGGVPVQDGPGWTVDDDPIPVTSTTTTDPTVQPADPVIPVQPVEAQPSPAPVDPAPVVDSAPVNDAPTSTTNEGNSNS